MAPVLPAASNSFQQNLRLSQHLEAPQNHLTLVPFASRLRILVFRPMLVSNLIPPAVSGSAPAIVQFPADAKRAAGSLRNMTTQLLQEAAHVIPNQQLLINVVSRRVRQLSLGHRPLVEATPRTSLSDIALKEIIAGKLACEPTLDKPASEGAA